VRDLAEAKRVALQADPHDLERERRVVVRQVYLARWEEVLASRGDWDLLLEASRQRLDAELAVVATPAERAAACERYWTLSKVIEMSNEEGFQDGRVSVVDLLATRYTRLHAEIRWVEVRERAVREKK
jgi:hypothetical protein